MRTLGVLILFWLGLAGCKTQARDTSLSVYTKEDILNDLEHLQPYKQLPDFEHPYLYTAGSRITLFADSTRWAIVFEKVGYGEGAELELTFFGNCLVNQPKQGLNGQYLGNCSYFQLITPNELANIEAGREPESFELVSRDAKQLKVRDTYLPIEHDVQKYKQKKINVQDFDNPARLIDFTALVRYLFEENSELFRATEVELRSLLPNNLPKLFVINKWHHKSYYVFPDGSNKPYGVKPRDYETYPMIGDILETKDTTKWKPTLKPNNDWRYWPKAGGM
ncbi:MAG: hypothetical protein ABWZ25_18635 [Chitinophagaceae bacterium]